MVQAAANKQMHFAQQGYLERISTGVGFAHCLATRELVF